MAKKKTTNSLWLPINLWNLNEVFTTESISPISFYAVRDFGNPVNRNQEKIEDINYLVLFEERVTNEIVIEVSCELLDTTLLIRDKAGYYEYSKTIYLRDGKFKVYFNSQERLQEFLTQQFMLLEVKTVNKYRSDSFIVDDKMINKKSKIIYQPKFLSEQSEQEPFFDKAFNQIKGLIYGYVIGSLGSLGDNEQGLVSDLTKLKNTIGGVHTDIALTEKYSTFWLVNAKKQIKDCSKRYFSLFKQSSTVFDTLILRLEEVDNLNKMRCDEFAKQKSSIYKRDYETAQNELEQAKKKVCKYESKHNITSIKEEFKYIQQEEKKRGEAKGKTREYYKVGENSGKYYRKKELKEQIEYFEKNDFEYTQLNSNIRKLEEKIKKYQFGGTQFDTSINEQFNRISEQLNDLVKRTNCFFLSQKNKQVELIDIAFKIDLKTLTKHSFDYSNTYNDFSIQLPENLANEISKEEVELLKTSLNAILSFPQGRLGNFSEEHILKILIEVGKHLSDSRAKSTLREYYNYRIAKIDNFIFPTNDVLANLIVFFMKLQGNEQINKLLISKGVQYKQIAFMLYGAYVGFANFPKTFTNLVFDNGNIKLQNHIDNYLFNTYLK